MPLVLITGSNTYNIAKFYFFSTQFLGLVNKHGVDVETVELMGPKNLASSHTQLTPWIEFTVATKDSETIICKAEGQYPIFGLFVSADLPILKIELEKLIISSKKTMQIYLDNGDISHCVVSKKISKTSYLFIFIFIATLLATVAVITKLLNSWIKFSKKRYV